MYKREEEACYKTYNLVCDSNIFQNSSWSHTCDFSRNLLHRRSWWHWQIIL